MSGKIGNAMLMHQFCTHLCIAINFGVVKSLPLDIACTNYALTDNFAFLSRIHRCELIERDRNNFEVNIDSVEQRSRYPVQVLLYHSGTTDTWLCRVVIKSAWTRIH